MNLAKGRIPSLDGLRTISVAFVLTAHFLYTIGFTDFLNLGILGVRFFFVISGFLITGLLLKEMDKTSTVSLTRFFFRRTLRIFPPYYFYLLLIFIGSKMGVFNIPSESFITPVTYTSNYFASDYWNLLHTWSLSVEEQFYLIFPFILLLLGRRQIIWILLALIVFCPFLRLIDFQVFSESQEMWIYYGFHANADGLATGCLLSIIYTKLHDFSWYRGLLNSRGFLIVPIFLIWFNSNIDPRQFYLGVVFTVSNILIAMCIDWSITNYQNWFGKILNSAPMMQIGVMSYSIYLWQQPFLNRNNPQWFNHFPYNFLGIAIFSTVSYYLVEKISLNGRQKLEDKLFLK
jgi:peptidoglycan/LPS O-acetylase OafA/YrhL